MNKDSIYHSNKWLTFVCLAMCIMNITQLRATIVSDTLYINPGSFKTVDDTEVEGLMLNRTDTFNRVPAVVHVSNSDELALTIINNDVTFHTLQIRGKNGIVIDELLLDAGATGSFEPISESESRLYNLGSADDQYHYAGLSSLLIFDDTTNIKPFYWNVRELKVKWLEAYHNLNIQDSTQYFPEYFTINNVSFPETLNDSLGYVQARLYDTIRIYLYNSGIMNHNFHFHGYHTTVIYSTSDHVKAGWEKDSFPLNTGEGLMMEFVPWQTGKYPAHNHNLGATLGNNIYPNGMVTWINITEQ